MDHNFGACILTPERTSAGVILLIYCKQICPKTCNNLRAHSVEGFVFSQLPGDRLPTPQFALHLFPLSEGSKTKCRTYHPERTAY